MSMLPLDIQANYGNLEIVVKEVNKVQNLSEQINYNSSLSIEKFAKEIYEKIIETDETEEQQKVDDRKKEDEKKKREKQKETSQQMSEEEFKRIINKAMESYKGNFVNILS